MNHLTRICIATLSGSLVLTAATGCTALVALADSKQAPPVNAYASKKPADRMFTAAVQAMGAFGKVSSSDRASGIVQGQKGSWVMNAGVVAAGTGSRLELSARYVPSDQMDFNSREGLTAQYLSLVEKNLGESLAVVP